jgi:hypothetical protein
MDCFATLAMTVSRIVLLANAGTTIGKHRHCEEQSDEAIHACNKKGGLLRGACHRARIRATRWLAMTIWQLPQRHNENTRRMGPGVRRDDVYYRAFFTGADNCSVRSRSVMSITVSIGAVSS